MDSRGVYAPKRSINFFGAPSHSTVQQCYSQETLREQLLHLQGNFFAYAKLDLTQKKKNLHVLCANEWWHLYAGGSYSTRTNGGTFGSVNDGLEWVKDKKVHALYCAAKNKRLLKATLSRKVKAKDVETLCSNAECLTARTISYIRPHN